MQLINSLHSGAVQIPLQYKGCKCIASVEKKTYEGTACSWKLESPLVQLIEKARLWVDEKRAPDKTWKCLS
jgi:hypothetical protein